MSKERGDGIAGLIIGLCIIGIIGFLIYQAVTPKTWTAFYDQSGSGITSTMRFDSKDACLAWIHSPTNTYGRYNLECGSNCRLDNIQLDLYRCEETID